MFTISATGLYQPVVLVDIFTPCFAYGYRVYMVTRMLLLKYIWVCELSHSQDFRDCQISVIMIELGW